MNINKKLKITLLVTSLLASTQTFADVHTKEQSVNLSLGHGYRFSTSPAPQNITVIIMG